MPAPKKIIELVKSFEEHKEEYKNPSFNETQLRRQFIDEFFAELGWDVVNSASYSETYREVIHEDKIDIAGSKKAPDYSFRLGGKRIFFVEAKKPSVDIANDIGPAYQLRRYGWSAKVPLSILTDFEEFAIYDTRIKPNPQDKASVARVLYFNFKDYPEKWDEIAAIFSKEAVLKGSFDKFAEDNRLKRGTATVDDDFLASIDHWRDLLARNIAIRNPDLSERELNYAITKTIDRLIFLRICEDRGIDLYGQLQILLEKTDIYKQLLEIFLKADERFNSGLFHFKGEKEINEPHDQLTPKLAIDDKVLNEIIENLYYPKSQYAFSVMPVEVLGQVYEQFLGKTIRLTAGHRAVVEEKPEVRKAGGVYYTPSYIVDYIVKNTVGKLCDKKTPKEVSQLKILDPACGSGSFLLGAYQCLIDWHRQYYAQNPTKNKKVIYLDRNNEYQLFTAEKKRILLNNIYGVDIDANAVEVTKLSMLLKVLEGESNETLSQQLKMFHERALPSLGNNIKCGNSLIGPDYFTGQLLPDENEMNKINPFDWHKEFAGIMEKGGFDAVIGNPPYVNMVALPEEQRGYFQRFYATCRNKSDLYSFFVERALKIARKNTRRIGFILPHTWIATDSFLLFRKMLFEEKTIEKIVEMGFDVFPKVTVSTIVLICSQNNKNIEILNKDFSKVFSIATETWSKPPYHIDLNWNQQRAKIDDRLTKNTKTLNSILQFSRGIKTSNDARFISNSKKDNQYKKVFRGRNIKAYELNWNGEYIWYRPDLMKEKVGCLPHSKEFFEVTEKLITQRVNSSMQLLVAYDNEKNYFLDTTNVSRYDSWDGKHSFKYLLGLLNSRLLNYWYCNKYSMPTIGLYELHSIPIHTINFSDPIEKKQHDKMVTLVDQMLTLHKKLPDAKTEHEQSLLKRQIEATDKQIDDLVFELYGLNEEEKKIVLENTK